MIIIYNKKNIIKNLFDKCSAFFILEDLAYTETKLVIGEMIKIDEEKRKKDLREKIPLEFFGSIFNVSSIYFINKI